MPTRQRLLDAAYDVLADEGYHATTVQHVARRAGLTSGAIYANFANKDELLVLAVLTRGVAAGLGAWSDLDGNGVDGSNLDELLVRHLSVPPAAEHRLLTEVIGAALRDRDARSLVREGVDMVASLARSAVDQAKSEGRLAPEVPTDAWVALTVNQFLGAITSKAFDLPQPDGEQVAELLRVFARSCRPE